MNSPSHGSAAQACDALPTSISRATLSLRELMPVMVVWLVLALLPVGRMSELPILIGIVGCVVLLFRRGRELWTLPSVRLALALFACYWLPALVSAFDAVEPGKTWPQVAAQLRFAPFAVFVAATLRTPVQWQWLLRASALLVLVWVIDAWVQAFTGVSLGGAMESDRLSGIFGADNLKLGGVLAALSPLLLAFAQQRFGLRGVFIAGLLLAGVILLAGARAAWVVYVLVLLGWCIKPFAGNTARALALTFALVFAGGALGFAAYHLSPKFAQRIDLTLHLANGNARDIDHALAGRVPIWVTAAAMAQAHPVNGVGVRGFRYAYADHAAPDDAWVAQGGAMHPHQLLLEIASETGVIGLAAWIVAAWLLIRAIVRASPAARSTAWPVLLALAAMCFPFNTHYAFYSSWWGLFFWWLVTIAVAVLHLRSDERAV